MCGDRSTLIPQPSPANPLQHVTSLGLLRGVLLLFCLIDVNKRNLGNGGVEVSGHVDSTPRRVEAGKLLRRPFYLLQMVVIWIVFNVIGWGIWEGEKRVEG